MIIGAWRVAKLEMQECQVGVRCKMSTLKRAVGASVDSSAFQENEGDIVVEPGVGGELDH